MTDEHPDFEFIDEPFPQSIKPSIQPVSTPSSFPSSFPSSAPPSNILGSPGYQPGMTSSSMGFGQDDPLPLPYGYDSSFGNLSTQYIPGSYSQGSYSPVSYSQRTSRAPPVGSTILSHAGHVGQELNCIDVAHHLTRCPVCSKLHKSSAPLFIGAIIVLLIIILFLGRKFFE